eukprot:5485306-Amphidinium_carterae.1
MDRECLHSFVVGRLVQPGFSMSSFLLRRGDVENSKARHNMELLAHVIGLVQSVGQKPYGESYGKEDAHLNINY